MRAVCSARVTSRPSQNSSCAIRASISSSSQSRDFPLGNLAKAERPLLLLLLLLLAVPAPVADVRQTRRTVRRQRVGDQVALGFVVQHPGVLGAAALGGVDDHRSL